MDGRGRNGFQEIKFRMSSKPILTTPNYDLPFHVACDCSNVALGAAVFHVINEIEHSISFISQKLNKHQRHYSTIEKECFSRLTAVKWFSVYFGSSKVCVYTDHNPLIYLDKMSTANQKLLRWKLQLQEFHLEIVHRAGKKNILPDILSRPNS